MTRRSRLLIANRGEIACRMIRTARAMGIHTIAVHSDLDRTAPHVRQADEAVEVASYLDIEAVVSAALERGADAIHPGYGFLSERAAFAQAVEDAGLDAGRPQRRGDGADGPQGRRPRGRREGRGPGGAVVRRRQRTPRPSTTRSWSRRPPAAAARACAW